MFKRWFPVAAGAVALLLVDGGPCSAGLFRGPWDFSVGPYMGGHTYSYNVAYGYFGVPVLAGANPSIWSYPYNWPYFWKYLPPRRRLLFQDDPAHNYVPLPPAGPPVAAPPPAPLPLNLVDTSAVVEVRVPAGAELWFDGDRTRQAGTARIFSTPPLPTGRDFHYEVRARWTENGRPVEQTQTVAVRAGQHAHVLFPKPDAGTAGAQVTGD